MEALLLPFCEYCQLDQQVSLRSPLLLELISVLPSLMASSVSEVCPSGTLWESFASLVTLEPSLTSPSCTRTVAWTVRSLPNTFAVPSTVTLPGLA